MLKEMEREGIGKQKYARKYKLDYAHLTRIFAGKANPGPGFLKRIGMERVKVAHLTYTYKLIE
jgi:hypothetical protein